MHGSKRGWRRNPVSLLARSGECFRRGPAKPVSATGRQRKSIQRVVEKVHALTDRSGTWQETTTLVSKVNRTLRGWANYFQVGTSTRRIGRSTLTQPCGCAGG